MSTDGKKKKYGVNPLGIVKKTIQGRIFLTFDFFKRNWLYILAITIMMLMYISNKYECQNSMQQMITLTKDLDNAKTDFVNSSAKYNSLIRESQMKALIDTMHINITSPEQPPYKLYSK